MFTTKDEEPDTEPDLSGLPPWEMSEPKDYPSVFRILFDFLPEGSVLQFEGSCCERGPLKTFLTENDFTPEHDPVSPGTLQDSDVSDEFRESRDKARAEAEAFISELESKGFDVKMFTETRTYNIPATKENLEKLAELSEHCAGMELASHFHVFRGEENIIDWCDAPDHEMWLFKYFTKQKMEAFCKALGTTYEDVSTSTD